MKEKDNANLRYLGEVFSKYNTEDILSTIIELQTFSEMGKHDDKKMQKAEWLVANLIRYNVRESSCVYGYSEFRELDKFAEQAVYGKVLSDIFDNIHEKTKDSDEEKKKFMTSVLMKAKNQVYRGDGYLQQLVLFAEKLYSEFDNEFKATLGFTYTTCQKFFIYIFRQYQLKSVEMFKQNFKLLKMIKSFIDTVFKNKKLINQSISGGYIFRIYHKELYDIFGKEEVDALIASLGRNLGEDTKYRHIGDFNPFCEKPILNFDGYLYVPLPLLTLQNLPKLFHYYFIAEKRFDKVTRAKYKKYRGDIIEELAIKYLGRLFDGINIHHSLKYDNDKEADLTVQQSDITIFCECKSKVLTLSSLQGDFDSIKSDFSKAIGDSFEQAVRTKDCISKGYKFVKLDEFTGKEQKVDLINTTYKYILCIVAEHFGWIPSNIKDYLQPDKIDKLLPVVSTIFDLDIITQECGNANEFVSYLQCRLENFDKVSSMDELEYFCMLRANNYQRLDIESDILTPIGYTDEIDRKYHKKDMEWLLKYEI